MKMPLQVVVAITAFQLLIAPSNGGAIAPSHELYALDSEHGKLLTIDKESGLIEDVGPTHFGRLDGLTYYAPGDALLAIGGEGCGGLVTINRTTGSAQFATALEVRMSSLAYETTTDTLYGTSWPYVDGNGNLYYNLYTINFETGDLSLIGGSAGFIEGLVFDEERDELLGIERFVGTQLVIIDAEMGGFRFLYYPPLLNYSGLAYDAASGRLFTIGRDSDGHGPQSHYLVSIGRESADIYTTEFSITGAESISQLAFAPRPVPEPSTAWFLCVLLASGMVSRSPFGVIG